jgi:methyl-accepting chemotaxis protein
MKVSYATTRTSGLARWRLRPDRVTEISEGGVRIAAIPSLEAGSHGRLRLSGFGLRLPFTVGASDAQVMRVVFRLQDDDAAQLRRLLDGLPARRAA